MFVSVGSGVGVNVAREVAVRVAVAVSVGVSIGVSVGSAVVAVAVAVDVLVAVGSSVGVREAVAEGDSVGVGVSVGSGDGVLVVELVAEEAMVASGVAVGIGVTDAGIDVDRRFSANCVAVWSIAGTFGRPAVLGDAMVLTSGEAVSSGTIGDASGLAAAWVTGIGVAAIGVVCALDCGEAAVSTTDAAGDGVAGVGEADRATGLAVPGDAGEAPATFVSARSGTNGEALATGLVCWVASRSSASWVRTAGATVTTISLGGADDRVSTRARRRLASSAPAATIAFVRFKRSLAVRARPATGGNDCVAGAIASCARTYTCSVPFYAQMRRFCQGIMASVLDIPIRFSMLARNCSARTYDRSF